MSYLGSFQLQPACLRLPLDRVRKCHIALDKVRVGHLLVFNVCLEVHLAVFNPVNELGVVLGGDGVFSICFVILLDFLGLNFRRWIQPVVKLVIGSPIWRL